MKTRHTKPEQTQKQKPINLLGLVLLATESVAQFIWIWAKCLFRKRASTRQTARHVLMMLLVAPLFLIYQIGTWCAHILDELFFRGYKAMTMQNSLFIVGIPRSGTTFLHRFLSLDTSTFTTMRTWEAFLAPSIFQKKICIFLFKLDQKTGGHIVAVLQRLENRTAKNMKHIHKLSLREPEEDFIVLLPAMSCFAMIAAFPESDWLWDVSRFDEAVSPKRRARIAAFYEACLQKHCYVHAKDKVYLSKNASFASWIDTLAQRFPTAQQVCCLRAPAEVFPSQLSSLRAAMQSLGNTVDTAQFKMRIMDMLKSYFDNIATQTGQRKNLMLIPTTNLQENLQQTIQNIYSRCGITMTAQVAQKLAHKAKTVKNRKSEHNYSLGTFNVSPDDIAWHFGSQTIFLQQLTAK